ncbi:MBL fold metallo-hydrolase [Amycolatopsis jejuensis]|uniref:MBL fold metallo-hydrolase n=1 Tax=Amycolatopsis jejuensis TaxID=330084 RepID=UPI000527F7E1|nr:MBL fold metallo-hydrolase [Amycolatopsis jejuensis]
MAATPYTTGLNRIADGCYAWFEPPGSWGLANSGIVVAGDEVLVVDTQNDVPRARNLRNAVREVAGPREITTVVNTHADGDHWFGNLLFEEARIFATEEAAAQMRELRRDPRIIRKTAEAAPGPALRNFLTWRADMFDYTGWRPVFPTDTVSTSKSLTVGGIQVDLIPVGPAHTTGDVLVHVPEHGVVFAGDIVFHRTTPMVWTGPLSNVVAACELILSLDPAVVVSGHGSAAERTGIRDLCDYLTMVHEHASARFAAGDTSFEAFKSIDLGRYRLWAHGSRVFQAINAVYRELDPDGEQVPYHEVMETVLAHDAY